MNRFITSLKVTSPLFLTTCCALGAQGLGVPDPVTSVYTEVAGAGGLRFEGIEGLDQLKLVEVGDFNADGVDDLLFAFAASGDVEAGFALGSIGEDGTTVFTVDYLIPINIYHVITAADLDGDGRPEICVRWGGSNSMVIFQLPADGKWSGEYVTIPFTAASYLVGIESGDLDGDGLADLVMNTSSSTVVIRWSSRPEGTEWQVYPVPQVGSEAALYDLRDYDGDGVLDVLLLNAASEEFVLLKGVGFDLVMFPEVIEIPVSGFVERGDLPYFGNFDGNGAVDVVLSNSVDGTSVVVPDFVTGESEAVALSLGEGERVVGVPGDLDGSGADEILVVGVDADSHVTRIIDEPSLVFDALTACASQVVIEVGNLPVFEGLDLPRIPLCAGVSLDGVGGKELLWMGDVRYYWVSTQVGLGEIFTRRGSILRVSPWRNDHGVLPRYGASQFEGQNVPQHMLPFDVDADGIDELIVVGTSSRGKLVDVNDAVSVNMSGVNDAFMIAMADFGGDGQPEAVFSRVLNSLVVLPVNGDGTFSPRILFANPNGHDYRSPLSADFDADGKDDVLMYDEISNEYHLWRGTGDASVELWTVTNSIPFGSTKASAVDFDDDGLPDLITGTSGGLLMHKNNGDGTFTQVSQFNAPYTPYWIETADMDHDGVTDIVCATRDGITMIFFMGSDLLPELLVKMGFHGSGEQFEIVAKDLNSDGLPDFIASASATGTPTIETANNHMAWIQISPRVFVPAGVLPASESSTITASDFNGDGTIDIATASNWDNSVRVHWGTPASCGADLTGDGSLNFLDISEFLSSQVDFDGSGSFNFLDISAYLVAYGAGCP